MDSFGLYSRYYDLFYAQKPYGAEARFVDELIRRWSPGASRLLELGCGTGRHARHLIDRGYSVHGVDRSEEMLAAITRSGQVAGFSACLGDARSYRDGGHYDSVLALFHVMSYLTTDEDLAAAVATASAHLDRGGLFIFDAWHGPAVLAQRPEVRERVVDEEDVCVKRTATPIWHVDEHLVDVTYHIEVTPRDTGLTSRFEELHRMRYLFTPEVEVLLDDGGFALEEACEFGTGRALGPDTWNACYVAVKQ